MLLPSNYSQYFYHVIKLWAGSTIASQNNHIVNWEDLKRVLTQYFGENKLQEYLRMPLESFMIENDKSFMDFESRVICFCYNK